MNPPARDTPIFMDQHALFVGTTGSGKSTRMVKQLARRMYRVRNTDPNSYKVVIVDTKPIAFGQSDDGGHYGKLYSILHRYYGGEVGSNEPPS